MSYALMDYGQDLKILSLSAFNETGLVVHGFSTRLGGVSHPPYNSLNLGMKTNDCLDHIRANRLLVYRSLGIDAKQVVSCQQTHSDNIVLVNRQDAGRGSLDWDSAIADTDAMITREKGIALVAFFADCVPVFVLDPRQKAVALIHAGWRGTVSKIAQQTINRMTGEFGTKPADCLVWIGPSIGPCCYEVDRQVISRLAKEFPYWQELVVPRAEGKWMLDLWRTNRCQLEDIGVLPKNIYISGLCTSCRNDLFFSHRADQGMTGRQSGLIMLQT